LRTTGDKNDRRVAKALKYAAGEIAFDDVIRFG
jgi:hypothetical protein